MNAEDFHFPAVAALHADPALALRAAAHHLARRVGDHTRGERLRPELFCGALRRTPR